MQGKSLVASGHEIWLENAGKNDNTIALRLLYGRHMAVRSRANILRISPAVYAPDGGRIRTEIRPADDGYLLTFPANAPGRYTAVADMEPGPLPLAAGGGTAPVFRFNGIAYAGIFHQMAKTIVDLDGRGPYRRNVLHGILELMPVKTSLSVGKEACLTVLYEGKKLPGAGIDAYSRTTGEERRYAADEKGKARIPIDVAGDWLSRVTHGDPSKKVGDDYNETVFVSTLTMRAG